MSEHAAPHAAQKAARWSAGASALSSGDVTRAPRARNWASCVAHLVVMVEVVLESTRGASEGSDRSKAGGHVVGFVLLVGRAGGPTCRRYLVGSKSPSPPTDHDPRTWWSCAAKPRKCPITVGWSASAANTERYLSQPGSSDGTHAMRDLIGIGRTGW